ncbi:hypothetical protein I633_22931 (plasmid) [Alteromonas mediterranea 615]|uniref:Uncharacterized protein n=1 Tax=Alteromonas mediterranea 615 TaxID=1300253 RepID=S5ALG4_9ALTE|nr:hypothetical protein I633_22931 [Alteromonas mediterranea 615]
MFEFDFLLTSGGRASEQLLYARMRHAYLKYNNWLIGQTWSTSWMALWLISRFIGTQTVWLLPHPNSYSNNGFEVAWKTRDNRWTTTPRKFTMKSVPDLIGTYTMKASWGHVKVGGICVSLLMNKAKITQTRVLPILSSALT